MNEKVLVYPIQYGSRKDIIKIKPIMDLHKGSKTCDIKAFKKFISEQDKNTYFFTNGDLWDAIYFSDKRFKASMQEHTDLDDPIDEEVKEMTGLLLPIKDRLICIGHGNHEETVLKRCHVNMSKRLSKALDVPYLGYSFWLRLRLVCVHRTHTVDLFCSHGFGGGTRTEGGSITKYSKFADRFSCDIFIVGHDHRKQFVRYPVLAIAGDPCKMYSRTKLVCLGGSWKKAYSNDTVTTWEETKGFMASEIGGVTIELKVKDPGVDINVQM
jgi:UDP-2,3-diacylglucosamine pyrophosphatase LpxH